MCGRFALKAPPRSIQEHFHLPEALDLAPPRFNIAPSQPVAVIRRLPENNLPQLNMLRWGLIPHWAKDMKIGYKLINARGETLKQKPSFRSAFKKRRCLIVADGFYEWRRSGKIRQPFYVQLKKKSVFGFAGLWESWNGPDGNIVESTTIITTVPNELISEVHGRMPVILHPQQYDTWLLDSTPDDALLALLKPYPADKMEMYQVGSIVNSPENDSPGCLIPV